MLYGTAAHSTIQHSCNVHRICYKHGSHIFQGSLDNQKQLMLNVLSVSMKITFSTVSAATS